MAIFDTIILYTFATIGFGVVIKGFYEYIESSVYLGYQRLNIKYYFPRVHSWFVGQKKDETSESSRVIRSLELSEKERLEKETEVMDDILSKTTIYYDSVKKLFESMVKDIPDTEQKKKIDQWYQEITKLIETPSDKSDLQDFKKRMSECSDQLFELMEKYR